jgi:membrane-bound ClpP family serine protease
MKSVRNYVDSAYYAMTGRIGALMIIEGEAAYPNFVKEINQRIESYTKLLAQRRGRNHKDAHSNPGSKE